MINARNFGLTLAAAAAAFCAIPAHAEAAASAAPAQFIYEDLDRFASALDRVSAGASPQQSFEDYVAGASPVFPFITERYGATGKSIAAAVAKRPNHYLRVAGLKPRLQAMEPRIAAGIRWLQALMPDIATPPVYFTVGNFTAGGVHAKLSPPLAGHETAPAVLIDSVAMSDETDMSEFPKAYGGGYLADVPYVAVHEMVHAYQARIMGLANYASIFRPGPSNTYLSQAIREGCTDYVTELAIGARRTGNQQEYGLKHEAELWGAFRDVMYEPLSFDDGWFGALDPKTPDWPPQIGYWLGARMCQAYHESAADKSAAMREIFSAYTIDQMRAIAAPYARKFAD